MVDLPSLNLSGAGVQDPPGFCSSPHAPEHFTHWALKGWHPLTAVTYV